MEDWKLRLQNEHQELCKRFVSLVDYLNNDNSSKPKLDAESLMLLETQKTAMHTYISILEIRMSRHLIDIKK